MEGREMEKEGERKGGGGRRVVDNCFTVRLNR